MNTRIETLYKYKNETVRILKSGIKSNTIKHVRNLLIDINELIQKLESVVSKRSYVDIQYRDIEWLRLMYKTNNKTASKIENDYTFFNHGILYFYECLRFSYQKLKQAQTKDILSEWLGDNYEYAINYDFSFWFNHISHITISNDESDVFILLNLLLSANNILADYIADDEIKIETPESHINYKKIVDEIFKDEFFIKEDYLNIKIIQYSAVHTYLETARHFSYSERTIRYKIKRIIDKLADMNVLYKISDTAGDVRDEDKRIIKKLNRILPLSSYFFSFFMKKDKTPQKISFIIKK